MAFPPIFNRNEVQIIANNNNILLKCFFNDNLDTEFIKISSKNLCRYYTGWYKMGIKEIAKCKFDELIT